MDTTELIAEWHREEQAPFAGWDFSYLKGRMLEEQAPWSYLTRAAALLRACTAALDMGTGGGERLLSLCERWPPKMAVTEDYPPNVALARERLAPLGVEVVEVALSRVAPMPFDDGEFDLVLNRHSGFNCDEVARILSSGGVFLTQQVHGLWAEDLLAIFGARPQWPDATPEIYVPELERAGLVMDRVEEWHGELAFADVGAIVYYLKAVPWLVPGFSVATHLDALLALQRQLDAGQDLVFTARTYLVEAHKPGMAPMER